MLDEQRDETRTVGSFSERTWRTRLASALSEEPLRSWIVGAMKLLGFRDEQWIRVVMNRETLQLVTALDPPRLDVLEISGSLWQSRAPFHSYCSVHYPSFDVCSDRHEGAFDLIVAEQVFEHVLRPYAAGRNVLSMLRAGGHFLITVPFLVRMHGFPTDCTRWTETGLKHFLGECGFPLDGIVTGSWGNAACVRSNLWVWKRYHPLLHSLRKERDFAVNVWALARKSPGEAAGQGSPPSR